MGASIFRAISIFLMAAGFLPNNTPVVTTTNGKIQGRPGISRSGHTYYEYLGIPFAEPPISNLRFESPVPLKKNWTITKQTIWYPPFCLQMDVMVTGRLMGQEDCLYLNVMTRETSPEKLKAVMVYIYGGGFLSGGTSMYGPEYFMDEDVVLVTINYRVGPLGFMNTGDGLIRGNMGLKDQNLALKWIQANIANFGGDPNRVTLFGESAGAAAVMLHMVSPASAGLFQRAIAQSGSVLSPWSFNKNPNNLILKYAPFVNCPVENGRQLVKCLKETDASKLVRLQQDLMNPANGFLAFVPSEESIQDNDTFLSDDPRKLWLDGKWSNRVPLLTGVTSGEGAVRTARFDAMPELIPFIDEGWIAFGPRLFSLHPSPGHEKILGEIRRYYFGNKPFTRNLQGFLQNLTLIMSDALFYLPARRAAMIHAKHDMQTFLYYYDYKSAMMPSMYSLFRAVRSDDWIFSEFKLAWSIFMDWAKDKILGEGPRRFGVSHGDDLLQLWNIEGWTTFFAGKDSEFSAKFIKAFADFARNEDQLKFDGVPWSAVSKVEEMDEELAETSIHLDYMLLGNGEARLIREPFEERMKFLKSVRFEDLSFN